jgi:hypothetical protein
LTGAVHWQTRPRKRPQGLDKEHGILQESDTRQLGLAGNNCAFSTIRFEQLITLATDSRDRTDVFIPSDTMHLNAWFDLVAWTQISCYHAPAGNTFVIDPTRCLWM